jgi:hypothetical protein
MTKAVVRIAQIATGDLLLSDTIKAGRELYHPRALQLAPNVPVLINHDEGRRIGRVVELDEWDDTDGRWVFARCVIDEVPEWLRGGSYSGSAASMAWVNLSHSQEMPGGWRRFNRGLITEVNILTPSLEPVEKRARVVLLQRSTATVRPKPLAAGALPTTRASTQPAGGEVTHVPPGATLRRPCGQVLGVR